MKARFPYQEFMFQKILQRKKTSVVGKPGCGKTRPIIDATVELGCIELPPPYLYDLPLHEVRTEHEWFPKGPIFVMCSGPAIATWVRQYPEWVGHPKLKDYIHVVQGKKHKRIAIWKQAATEPGIYITNFACFRLDYHVVQQIRWAAVIADEYHKVMRRKESSTFKRFRSWTRHQEIMILATGSSVTKNPGSMWTAFTLIDPALKLFRSYWRYIKTFCIVEEGAYGQEILGIKNVEGLKNIMDKYFAYVPAEVIADQQPEGFRSAMYVDMNKEQVGIYEQLAEDALAFLDSGDIIVAPTVIGKILKMRQLLCCPRILDPSLGMGGGYEAIIDRLEEQPHVIIFVPFRDAVTLIAEDLQQRGFTADKMMGGVKHEEQSEILDRFRINKSILVCTIAYAESFDCETCETSYFLGYDFNVDPNEQAEGRTQRAISEHKFVTWNYVCHRGTYDEIMLMNLDADMKNISRVLARPKELINALKGIQHG